MANEELLNNNEEAMEEVDVYTLVDEEGNEGQFQIIGEHEMNGVVYYALVPVDEESDEYIELINPEIIEASGEQTGTEGCLSVPGKQGIVTRPSYVKVKALNRKGEEVIYEGTDLLARCFCHELDHLDGTLYIDKAKKMLYPDEDGYYEEDED